MSIRPPRTRSSPAVSAPEDGVAWRRRKAERRPELLAAARTLIEDEGAENVTMVRIAKAAGVSEATVYKYFENKEDLINQVVRAWATPFVDRLVSELSPLTEIRSRLILIAIRYLRSFEETPRLHRVFFREIRWGDYRNSPLREINVHFTKQMTETIEQAQAAGQVADTLDARLVRDMLFGGLEHIALRTIFAGRPIDVEHESAAYVDTMLSGLLVRPSEQSPVSELDRLAALVDRMEQRLG